jgi:predicted patatin/cPLA2 family phospholipase
MKRALIIRGGSMKGAFSVGVLVEFYRLGFGADKFEAIYSNSVGIFQQAFFSSGQIENMEKGWRDYVTGKQLIHYKNVLQKRAYIDLDYLIDLYKSDKCYLDLETLKNSKPQLYCIVTDYETKEPVVLDLKKYDVFEVMRATCAVPFL